jgi:DNA-binding NtrC family response regulator
MSVLSEKREIDGKTIQQFIPIDEESTQLAVINNSSGNHSYENERETLYKILNELSGNVRDLKREMNGLRQRIDDATEITSKAVEIRNNLPAVEVNNGKTASVSAGRMGNNVEYAEAEEISETESLNINEIGRQLIEKALERNGGNRKKAAKELGFSDRTLYRKLKQYGMDNK